LGEMEAGLARLQQAVDDAPHQAELHDRLVKAFLMAHNLSGAAEAAERFAACMQHPKTFMRAASIRAQLQQWDKSEKLLRKALQLFPQSADLQNAFFEVERKRAQPAAPGSTLNAQAGA